MPPVEIQSQPTRTRRKEAPVPLRRRRVVPARRALPWRKALDFLLLFVVVVLVVDALVGDKGLMDTVRARQRSTELQGAVERLRSENAELRERAKKLDKDASTIESLAREELGLIRPGELLFILKNAAPGLERGSVGRRP
jgi:cell division protein FtsB